jgi:hypothetical protein
MRVNTVIGMWRRLINLGTVKKCHKPYKRELREYMRREDYAY